MKGLEQEIRLTESQIDKYKLDMSLEKIRKLSSTMEPIKQAEPPKPQQKPSERKIEPSTRIEKPKLSATQQFDVLMDQLARQQQQKVIDQLRAEMKELQSEYAKQTELSKKPKPMLFGKLKWEQEQAEIRGNLNNLKRRFDTNKTRISNLKKQKPYGSHENYNAIAEKHPALFQEMLKEKEQQEQIRQRQRDLEPTRTRTQSKDRER